MTMKGSRCTFAVWIAVAHAVRFATGDHVVTLGDSYSTGLGSSKDGAAEVADFAPGFRLARERGDNSILLSSVDFVKVRGVEAQFDRLQVDYPAESRQGWANTTMVLTAGGWDAFTDGGRNWRALITNCVLRFRCYKNPDNQGLNTDELSRNFTQLYTRMAEDAPNAVIRVLGYPRLFQPPPFGFCVSATGISAREGRFFDNLVDDVNDVTETVIEGVAEVYPNVDIQFVNVEDYFTRGACSLFGRQVNEEVVLLSSGSDQLFDFGLSDASYHPTIAGYDAYYRALVDTLPTDVDIVYSL